MFGGIAASKIGSTRYIGKMPCSGKREVPELELSWRPIPSIKHIAEWSSISTLRWVGLPRCSVLGSAAFIELCLFKNLRRNASVLLLASQFRCIWVPGTLVSSGRVRSYMTDTGRAGKDSRRLFPSSKTSSRVVHPCTRGLVHLESFSAPNDDQMGPVTMTVQ